MQKVLRLILVSLFATIVAAPSWAMEDPGMAPATPTAPTAKPTTSVYASALARGPLPPAEYKRNDANFYPKAELLMENPTAVIIPKNKVTQKGDSYFFTPKIRAPKNIYMEVLNDWIEPITPPDMPASLGVAPDAMQIREPQGDVEVALPSAPASFAPATDNMTLPNGAVVKTGDNGTAAVLFGGVDSARLMPDSAAAVQQTVTAETRSAEVDLTAGGVFSKVGTQIGVKGEYEVHTPFGNAMAHGGDFVTISGSDRTDVWVAKGTVSLEPPDSKEAKTITSDGTGALKLISSLSTSSPLRTQPAGESSPDAETLTAVLNFIPLANQKIKALHEKVASGATLTANEQAYLGRIRQVPSLIKLALVEPPAPPPPPVPVAPPPAPHLSLSPQTIPPPPAPIVPLAIDLQADNSVTVDGAPASLDDLKSRLADIAKANPKQPILITGREKVTHAQLLKVVALCHDVKLKVKVAKAAPLPKAAPPAIAATPPPTIMPIAPKAEPPTISPTPPPAPPAPVVTSPIEIVLRADGKVDLMGQTMGLDDLKSKLAVVAKANTAQPIVIKGKETAQAGLFRKVRAIYKGLKLKMVVIEPSPPAPAKAPETSPAPAVVEAPAVAPAVPAVTMTPATNSVPEVTPPAPATTETTPAQTAAPVEPKPIAIRVRMDGKINLQGSTFDLPGLKSKLEKLLKAMPDQAFVLRAGKTVPYDKVQAVLDVCANAQVKHLDVEAHPSTTPSTPAPTAPTPATATETPTAPASENLPKPSLRMNPYLEQTPTSALPPPSPTLPTTNSPPEQPGP